MAPTGRRFADHASALFAQAEPPNVSITPIDLTDGKCECTWIYDEVTTVLVRIFVFVRAIALAPQKLGGAVETSSQSPRAVQPKRSACVVRT